MYPPRHAQPFYFYCIHLHNMFLFAGAIVSSPALRLRVCTDIRLWYALTLGHAGSAAEDKHRIASHRVASSFETRRLGMQAGKGGKCWWLVS
jgi:hypothetical protein